MSRLSPLFALLLIISMDCFSQAQTIQLNLIKKIGEGPFKIGIMPTFTNIEDNFILPKVTTSGHLVKYYKLHYTSLKTDTTLNARLYLFIARIGDSIVVIPDTNFNNDFTDDSAFYYSQTRNPLIPLPYIEVQSPIDKRSLILQPYPYNTSFSYNSPIEQSLYLVIKGYEHFEIEQSIIPVRLYLANRRPTIGFGSDEDIMIAVNDSSGIAMKRIGDFVTLKDQQYIITSVDKKLKSILLTEVNKTDKPIGTATNFWISPFTLTTITAKTISIPSKKEYTLLDFWGTWCSPCLALTPKIKAMVESHRNNLELLSIALDDDIHKVKDYIKNNKLKWNHLIESRDESPYELTRRFSVTEFPTFILIDRKGKIISRGATEKALDEIIHILDRSSF